MPILLAVLATLAALGSVKLEAPSPGPPASNSVSRQEESTSDLTFRPENPRPGATVELRYRPSPELAGEDRVHLRARLRTPDDESYNQGMGSRTVAILDHREDGTFTGSFQLPEDVVFGAFAVENPDGTRVDGRDGLFWELMVHDEAGRPRFEALEQRFHDHMGRNEPGVLESARELARLYPERPQSWTLLSAAEGWFLGEEGAEDREAAHLERAAEFDRAFRERNDLTEDDVAFLYWYGRGEVRERWRERLLEDFPGHFFAAQERGGALVREHPDDPRAVQEGLEALWEEVEEKEAKLRVLRIGLSTARQSGDVDRVGVWATRWRELDPVGGRSAALTLSTMDGLREEGISMLSEIVAKTEAAEDGDRELGATVAAHQEASRRQVAVLKRYLGDALVRDGHTREGIAVLEEVAAQGWWPDVFRSLGETYRSTGGTDRALRHFAALAADPGVTEEKVDSLRQVAGVDASAWREAMESARTEMIRRTLESSEDEELPMVRVTGPDGSPTRLQDHLGPEATVMVMWSRYCGFSNQAMPRIMALTKELAEEGVPFLALTRDPVGEASSYLAEEGLEINALFDVWGEAGRALNAWGTPQYYILDGEGHLRFPTTTLDDIPRQVMALRSSDEGR